MPLGPRRVFPEMDWEVTRDLRPYWHGLGLPVAVVMAVKRCPLFDIPVEQLCRPDTKLPFEGQRYSLARALVAVGLLLDFDQAELYRVSVVSDLL